MVLGHALNQYRYSDDEYEYRHVQLPKDMLKKIPADYFDPTKGTLKLLWEQEWRSLGITQVRLSPSLPKWVSSFPPLPCPRENQRRKKPWRHSIGARDTKKKKKKKKKKKENKTKVFPDC